MKVLLLNGSPNAQGCTYTALSEVAGALEKMGLKPKLSRSVKASFRLHRLPRLRKAGKMCL